MLELSKLENEVVLKIGQKAYYQGDVHGSVGIGLMIQVEDEEVLKLSDTHFTYDNPGKSNMPGGDGGTKTFIFEALKAGTTRVNIKKDFRGETQDNFDIKVVVNE